jgi:hypothetical protein
MVVHGRPAFQWSDYGHAKMPLYNKSARECADNRVILRKPFVPSADVLINAVIILVIFKLLAYSTPLTSSFRF